MATSKIKAVLIGCGGMSRAWLKPACEFKDVQLVGLVDLNRQAAEQRAAEFKLPPEVVFNTLAEAIKATKADVVFDVTIPEAHDKVTLEALRAGCHVLGEKPMSVSMDRARRMVAAAAKAKRIYAVIQNRRYEPNIQRVAKVLRSGKIGRAEEIHCDFFLGPHFSGFRDVMAHPLLVDMAIHTFDAARYIGAADPVAVYCHAFNPKRSWYKGDASAIAIFEMKGADGEPIVFCYRGSWCAEGLGTSWNSQWRIVASKGTLLWQGDADIRAETVVTRGKKRLVRQSKQVKIPDVKVKHLAHEGLIQEFIKCVKTGGTPQTHCGDNIRSLAMVLAAVKSAASGKRELVRW